MSNSSDIKMVSYFNIDEGKTDWSIFGGAHGDVFWNNFHAYSAYRNCNEWIEPNITIIQDLLLMNSLLVDSKLEKYILKKQEG
jgi:hypothetical protein